MSVCLRPGDFHGAKPLETCNKLLRSDSCKLLLLGGSGDAIWVEFLGSERGLQGCKALCSYIALQSAVDSAVIGNADMFTILLVVQIEVSSLTHLARGLA